jgi:dihydroorotase
VREAKARGLSVTAEVTPHHLLLTDSALLGYDTACKVAPPLRSEEHVAAVREALADGTIDVIATDHAPHSSLEKDCEMGKAAPGMIGLELCVPLLLGLVREGALSTARLIDALTRAPARVVGIEAPALRVGGRADAVLVDPESRFVVRAEDFRSKSTNTPFLSKELQGRVLLTLARGQVAFERRVEKEPS